MSDTVVAALYKFVALDDFHELREPLLDECLAAGIRGTLLLAHEGLNGTIAGSREGIDRVLAYLKSDPRLVDLEHKESYDDHIPFYRMKVKLKKEIVTMGLAGVHPTERAGSNDKKGSRDPRTVRVAEPLWLAHLLRVRPCPNRRDGACGRAGDGQGFQWRLPNRAGR